MFPQNLDIQRSKDQRAVDIYSGVSAVLNTVQLQHYPDWMLKYLPLEGMKKGREGNRKYKAAAMDYINEVKSKGISTSEDPAEGTMYEQLEAKGMPSEEIIIILADFLAGGADTVSLVEYVFFACIHVTVIKMIGKHVVHDICRFNETSIRGHLRNAATPSNRTPATALPI